MLPTFHHLLQDFTKSVGLDLELPPADELESFEFELDGTRCLVRPGETMDHVILEAGVMRLDALPLRERAGATRFLHGLNRAALATNGFVATVNVDEEIAVSKVLPTRGLAASTLGSEMLAAIEAAKSLATSLNILGSEEQVPPLEPEQTPAMACPLQLA